MSFQFFKLDWDDIWQDCSWKCVTCWETDKSVTVLCLKQEIDKRKNNLKEKWMSTGEGHRVHEGISQSVCAVLTFIFIYHEFSIQPEPYSETCWTRVGCKHFTQFCSFNICTNDCFLPIVLLHTVWLAVGMILLSVCLSVTLCIVVKWYILQISVWTSEQELPPPLVTWFYNLQPPTPTLSPQASQSPPLEP